MQVNTRDFGEITVDPNDIFEFPQGIYGFEDDKRFALFNRVFDDVPFLYMQSADNIIPCFLVFEPIDFCPDYEPSVSEEDLKAMGVKSAQELTFLAIANIPESIEDLSINLKSPIVLNPAKKQGHQVILQNPDYSIRYKPFSKESKGGS